GIAVYPQSSVSGKRGLAAIESDASPKRVFQDGVVFFREVEGVTKNRVGIRQAHGRLETKPLRRARVFGGVGVADEQFGRNASAMWTSATQWSFFDECDIHPFDPAINGGRNRVAATEHNEIVVFGIHIKEMSRSVSLG